MAERTLIGVRRRFAGDSVGTRWVLAVGCALAVALAAHAQEWRVPPRYDELRYGRADFDRLLETMDLDERSEEEARAVFAEYDYRLEALRSAWFELTRWVDSLYPWVYGASDDRHGRDLEIDMERADRAWLDEASRLESVCFERLASLEPAGRRIADAARDDRLRERWSSAMRFGNRFRFDGQPGMDLDLVDAVETVLGDDTMPLEVQRTLDDYQVAIEPTMVELDELCGSFYRSRRHTQWAVRDAMAANDAAALERAASAWVDALVRPSTLAWQARHLTITAAERVTRALPSSHVPQFRAIVDRRVNPFLYDEGVSLAERIESRLLEQSLPESERSGLMHARRQLDEARRELGTEVVARYESLIAPVLTRATYANITRRWRGLEMEPSSLDALLDAFNEAFGSWKEQTSRIAGRVDAIIGPAPQRLPAKDDFDAETFWAPYFTAWLPEFPDHIESLSHGDPATAVVLQTLWSDHVLVLQQCSAHWLRLQSQIKSAREAWEAGNPGAEPWTSAGRDFGSALVHQAWMRDRFRIETSFEENVTAVLGGSAARSWRDLVRSARRKRVLADLAETHRERACADLRAAFDGISPTEPERAAVSEALSSYEDRIETVLATCERRAIERRDRMDDARGVGVDPRPLLEIDEPIDRTLREADMDRYNRLHEQSGEDREAVRTETERFTEVMAAKLPPTSAAAFRLEVAKVVYPSVYTQSPVDVLAPLLRNAFNAEGR